VTSLQSAADKLLSPKERFYSGQKFGSCVRLQNVASRSVAQSRRQDIRIFVLGYEEYFRLGD